VENIVLLLHVVEHQPFVLPVEAVVAAEEVHELIYFLPMVVMADQ
jgi:hypothetical protein